MSEQKYRLYVEFAADSDDEANGQVFGSDEEGFEGAQHSFDSIYSIRLTRDDGSEVQ